MTTPNKDGWKPHDGGPRPVAPDTWVQRKSPSGDESAIMRARDLNWGYPWGYRVFAPVVDQPGPSDFVRETAARIMAALMGGGRVVDYTGIAADAVAAAIALEAALKEVGK